MIVAGCNLLTYLLVEGEFTKPAEAVYLRDSEWGAPFLWRSEFRNVLASQIRRRTMSLPDALQVMRNTGLAVASAEVLSEAASARISAYDAEYVVLARHLSIPLVTSDRKLHSAVPSVACSPDAFVSLQSR